MDQAQINIDIPKGAIKKFNINKLRGRVLRLPALRKNRKEILLIYGHHASIERMYGFADFLSSYGNVTLPDLPGFGGMDSFYKIGEKPTLDNLADYLAAFIKLHYRHGRKFSIFAMSFGFAVVVRMLQRHPELEDRVELLISLVGFTHKYDFKFSRRAISGWKIVGQIFSTNLMAWIAKNLILRPGLIRWSYLSVADRHSKLKDADIVEREARIKFEIELWQINDIRTYMYTTLEMFRLNLCNIKIGLPLYHVAVAHDRYFDNHAVEQHLKVVFKKVEIVKSAMPAHAPTVIASASASAPFIPKKIRDLLKN